MSVQRRPKKGKNKNGKVTWIVRWRDINKKEHSRSFSSERAAKKFDEEVAIKRRKGGYTYTYDDRITLKEYALKWISLRHIRPATKVHYNTCMKNIIGSGLSDYPLVKLTRQDIQEFYNNLVYGRPWVEDKSALLPSSADQVMTSLSTILASAMDDGIILRNPVKKVNKVNDNFRLKEHRENIPTAQQVRDIVSAVRDGGFTYKKTTKAGKSIDVNFRGNPTIATAIELAVNTGLRVSEVFGLIISDIDTESREINVTKQKSPYSHERVPTKTLSSVRTVYYPDSFQEQMLELIGEREGHEFLFSTTSGNPYSANHVSKILFRTCKHLGYRENFSFHAFRHFFASNMLANNVPVTVVAKILGHSSIAVTMSIYSHVLKDSESTNRDYINSISSPTAS